MLFLVTNFIATAEQSQGTCPEVSEPRCAPRRSPAAAPRLGRARSQPREWEGWRFVRHKPGSPHLLAPQISLAHPRVLCHSCMNQDTGPGSPARTARGDQKDMGHGLWGLTSSLGVSRVTLGHLCRAACGPALGRPSCAAPMPVPFCSVAAPAPCPQPVPLVPVSLLVPCVFLGS